MASVRRTERALIRSIVRYEPLVVCRTRSGVAAVCRIRSSASAVAVMLLDWTGYDFDYLSSPKRKSSLLTGYLTGYPVISN